MALVKSVATPSHPGQHIPVYLGMVQHGEQALAKAYREVGRRHADNAEIDSRSLIFANRSESAGNVLQPLAQQYGADTEREAEHWQRRSCRLIHRDAEGCAGLRCAR